MSGRVKLPIAFVCFSFWFPSRILSHYFVEFLLQKSGGNLSLCYVFKNWQIFERMINLNGLLHWNVKIDDIVHYQSFFTMFSQVWLEKWKKMTPNLAFHNKKWGDFRTKIWRYWHYWYSAGARQVPHLGAKIRFEGQTERSLAVWRSGSERLSKAAVCRSADARLRREKNKLKNR